MSSPLMPSALVFSEDDVLFSPRVDDGVGQTHATFLAGSDLPQRWRQRDCFVIVETGFGLGLNFLATWAQWKADPAHCTRLHFIALEQHPFGANDLATLHTAWPEFADLSAVLIAAWPPLTPGLHALSLEGHVTLSICFGDRLSVLPELVTHADAFYLSGFSRANNPVQGSPSLFRQLARLARPDTTLVADTTAEAVKDGLSAVGFSVTYSAHSLLHGVYARRKPTRILPRPVHHALVIGAGLAGCSSAERLAARGWQVSVIEQHAIPAQEASGNHSGVLLPVLSLDDNAQSRLARAGFFYTQRHLNTLVREGAELDWGRCGVLQLARDAEQAQLQQRILAQHAYPPDYVIWLDQAQASHRAGRSVAQSAWWFPQGAWINPPSLCHAQLARWPQHIHWFGNSQVARLMQERAGEWCAYNSQDELIAHAPVVIVACASAAAQLLPSLHLPLIPARRIMTLLPTTSHTPLNVVLCQDSYLTPAYQGLSALGAAAAEDGTEATVALHALNLDKLAHMLPNGAHGINPATLNGRVCDRPGSPDRLPLVGQLAALAPGTVQADMKHNFIPRTPGLYAALGFGARGLTWASLAGELLACQINGEPWPLERDLVHAIDPARFALRAARELISQQAKRNQ